MIYALKLNFLRITNLKIFLFLKTNVFYLVVIFLLLISECYNNKFADKELAVFWNNNLRILSWLAMGIWYYQILKGNFTRVQKLFLVSILLPIIVSFSTYLLPERQAISINIGVNIAVLCLWIYVFKFLGAAIILRDQSQTFSKLVPAFFILPLLFYFFSLYKSLSTFYAILVLIYILVFSYTGILAAFLPFNEERRLWITFGIMLLVLVNIMNGYHTFLQKITNVYPIIRTMTVISRCMMIYGMIGFDLERSIRKKQFD